MPNVHSFEDKEPASDFHIDVAKSSYEEVSVVQPNQISDTQEIRNEYYHFETESCRRCLSDEDIVSSMKTESDEQRVTGVFDV